MDEYAVKLRIVQSAGLTGGQVQALCTPRLYLIQSDLIQSGFIQSKAYYFLQLFTLPIIKNITLPASSPKTLLKNPRI